MSAVAQLMRYTTAHAHDAAARVLGARAPYFYVAEFPRSGGNWLRNLLGDALQVPVVRFSALPVTFPAILQTHSDRPFKRARAVYLVRDGRDVFLSHYHKAVNSTLSANSSVRARTLSLHPSLARHDAEALRGGAAISTFYDEWRRRPLGSRSNWGDHVGAWTQMCAHSPIKVLRYEDLVAETAASLSAVCQHLTDQIPASYVLDFAVRRNSFSEKTGRKPGEIDGASNQRGGTIGLWRKELPAAIAQAIWTNFRGQMEGLGYGAD